MSDQRRGLTRKYDVRRVDGTDGPGGKHDQCSYYVLDLTHDKHAIPALHAYAESCAKDYPMLARDLQAIVDGNELMKQRCNLPALGEGRSTPETPEWLFIHASFVLGGWMRKVHVSAVSAVMQAISDGMAASPIAEVAISNRPLAGAVLPPGGTEHEKQHESRSPDGDGPSMRSRASGVCVARPVEQAGTALTGAASGEALRAGSEPADSHQFTAQGGTDERSVVADNAVRDSIHMSGLLSAADHIGLVAQEEPLQPQRLAEVVAETGRSPLDALITECCGRQIAGDDRYCPKCGWECRVLRGPAFPPEQKEIHADAVTWFKSKGFIQEHEDGNWCISWFCWSGYDFTSLEFFRLERYPNDCGWDAIIGHHASGTNPRLTIGRCETLTEVKEVYDLIRRLNGYKKPEVGGHLAGCEWNATTQRYTCVGGCEIRRINESVLAASSRSTAPQEDDYDKQHLDGCRKLMYDRKSSPCTCRLEFDRLVGELQILEAELTTLRANLQEPGPTDADPSEKITNLLIEAEHFQDEWSCVTWRSWYKQYSKTLTTVRAERPDPPELQDLCAAVARSRERERLHGGQFLSYELVEAARAYVDTLI